MPEYRCVWEIDVTADSPEDAARQARAMQQDQDAMVGVFTVKELPNGEPTVVDTDELSDEDDAPDDTDPENIYNSPTIRQSIEEDRK